MSNSEFKIGSRVAPINHMKECNYFTGVVTTLTTFCGSLSAYIEWDDKKCHYDENWLTNLIIINDE